MPGKLADMYEECLSKTAVDVTDPSTLVKRIGKPFMDIYQAALDNVDVDLSRVCMVGDALETDVTGGSQFGIATVWVLMDGIHSPELQGLDDGKRVLNGFNANSKNTYAGGETLKPDYLLSNFRW
jgi:ribonucleotide monophosphatase NagD (HAD superfamily)